ncbi:unnamed protein product [Triticum turgidum subsp. durum]|uniref:Bifunctional inhibitor/plant lipid transfer protein/seed storage helical domain-containing protein n=1 Tax=Triticum turgidum subsp. durum TaxID=4567 RepID=A0A9R0VQU3_TRITD|nr:unnamed protein product [Triticum turgidum subsp. durum]
MTISAFVEESPTDEDDGPGVRRRRCHDPPVLIPEPPLADAEAHDLPITGVVEEEGLGRESYCSVGSNEASPSGACCGAVRGANFKCLCKYKGFLPKDIDANRAMQIPAKCGYGPASC